MIDAINNILKSKERDSQRKEQRRLELEGKLLNKISKWMTKKYEKDTDEISKWMTKKYEKDTDEKAPVPLWRKIPHRPRMIAYMDYVCEGFRIRLVGFINFGGRSGMYWTNPQEELPADTALAAMERVIRFFKGELPSWKSFRRLEHVWACLDHRPPSVQVRGYFSSEEEAKHYNPGNQYEIVQVGMKL